MRQSFFLNSLVFATSRYVLLGLSVVRNFVVASALGPADFGVWVIVTLVTSYGDQVHLGLRHAGDKEIPYRRASMGEEDGTASANSLYGGILVLSVIAFFGLVLYGLIVPSESEMIRVGLIASAVIILSDQVNRFYLMILRAYKEFVFSSKVEVAIEFLRTFSVCALAFVFGFFGVVGGFLIASISMSIYLARHFKDKFRPTWDFQRLKGLAWSGSPLFVWGLLYLVITSMDRVAGGFLMSKTELGVYGVASLLAQVPVTSSQGISAVLYPRMSEQLGTSKDPGTLLQLFDPVVKTMAVLVPPLVATFTIVATFALNWLLPAYRSAIDVMFLLSNGIYFLCVAPIPMFVLMAAGKKRMYILGEAAGIAVTIPLFIFLPGMLPISSSIAVAVSAGYFVCTTILLFNAYSMTSGFDARILTLKLYLPTFISICIVILAGKLFPGYPDFRLTSELLRTVEMLLIYWLGFVPVLVWWGRRSETGRKLLSRLMLRRSA